MSSYRDDTQETAVASDATWLNIAALAEDSARAVASLLFALAVTHGDQAMASDEVIDRAHHVVQEVAVASDSSSGHLQAAVLVAEQARVSERLSERLRVLQADSATAGDTVLDRARAVISERATASDTLIGQRRAQVLITESARASDFTGQFASALVSDAATASDWTGGRQRAVDLLTDTAMLGDELLDAHRAAAAVLVEVARADALVVDRLLARELVQELAVGEDAVPSERSMGQAWTANADTWAMSRYAPFAFDGLAVIDGKLYAMAADGIYALGQGAEVIEGRLTTGKLDLGKGALVHPTAAYLEYQLADTGSASMDVTTTQSGAEQTYSYPLEAEPAAELTNGRFKFGRGLRGRHFSFVLRLSGRHAHINDLRLESAPTNRRV